MINYELGLLIAIAAFVYSYILTRPHMILNGLHNWLYAIFKVDEALSNGKKINPLFMILIYCEKCMAGQLAFWLFLSFNYASYTTEFTDTFLTHIFFTAYTIFCAAVICKVYTKYIE